MVRPARTVYLPVAPRVRVRCEHDHTLRGLYVLHRVEGAAEAFTLSFVGADGFLQVLGPGDDPWVEFYKPGRAAPRRPKLVAGRYHVVAVRHPDVRVARALLAELGDHPGAVEAFERAHPGALRAREVAVVASRGGRFLTLTLPDDPHTYLPAGPALYDGWTLYGDMPHAACEAVSNAVRRLRAHLGALSYVTGIQEAPYAPCVVGNGREPRPLMASAGAFDAGLLNAVVTFQTDASAGRAWRVADPEGARGALVDLDSPVFEARAEVTLLAAAEASWRSLRARHDAGVARASLEAVDGVVGASTAGAIVAWLTAGWRKRGAVLVAVPGSDPPGAGWVYLREEAALAVEAWRAALVAMGCAYGLASGHSFRSIASGVGTQERGVASQSLHKTGLAIDLAVKGTEGTQTDYAYPTAAWPIVFERAVLPAVVRDGSRSSGIHRITWRLYGHSTLRVAGFASPESRDRADLVASLRACAGAFVARLDARLGAQVDGAGVVSDALRAEVGRLAGVIRALAVEADRDPASFLERYLRGWVVPWRYDPYSEEAGTLGDPLRPDEPVRLAYANAAAATSVTRPDARSFVNLSAVGQRFGMLRISAAASGWQNEAADDDSATVYDDRQAIPSEKNLPFVLDRLRKLARSSQRDAAVRLVLPGGDPAAVVELAQADLDVDALERWMLAVERARRGARSPPLSLSGAQVSIDLALGAASRAAVDALLAAMEGELAGLRLRLTSGVDFAPDGFEDVRLEGEGVKPASAWAALVRAVRDELAAAQAARAAGPGRRASRPRRVGDWTVELHPLAVRGRDDVLFMAPGQKVILPASGTGRALEWWHFQHRGANGRAWIDLLEEVGFTPEVLAPGRSASLHRRAGLGYDPRNWLSARHGAADDAVENTLRDIDRGSVLRDGDWTRARRPRR